jgi:glycosyltransferase involved in cell wall biosynthesis
VVITSYNYARFLPAAIESALHQTHPRVEIIVVDDGSTDESPKIVVQYAAGGRIVPLLKANGGQGSAVNRGFAACRGDIVLFLDSDDILAPTACERAAAALQDVPAIRAYWKLNVIGPDGSLTGGRVPVFGDLPDGDLLEIVLRDGPDSYAWPPTSGNAWARRFLEQVLPMPEHLFRTYPDVYLTAWAAFYGPVVRLDEPQSSWRIHGMNHTWRPAFDNRVSDLVAKWDVLLAETAEHCRRRGLSPDVRRRLELSWFHRLKRASDTIAGIIPADAAFILADEDQWDAGSIVAGRRRWQFLERDGVYWGAPADDAQAIRELERLRGLGAGFIVFASPAFWWLDHYSGLRRLLEEDFGCVHRDELIAVFDLRKGISPAVTAPSLTA